MGNTPNSRYEVDVVSVALSQGHKHSTLTSHGDSRELGTPTAIVRNSLRTSIRTRPYSIAGKLCSYAALTGLTVLLVSFTPQMHHNTDTASAATSNSTGGMQRDTTYQTQEGLAPLLGANEGLLRPGAASAVNLPMPSFMRGWLSPSFPRQHGIQTHAWRSTLAWNQLTAPYAAQYQPVKAPSPSTTLWARLAHVTEQNQQLESKLAAATQTARLYEDARLRLAEVESDLARVSEESKLSSAYLVAAVRQLSSASQTLDAPTASHSQSTVPAWRSDVAGAKVLLGLAAAIWVALHHRHKSSLYAEQHALEEAGAELQQMRRGRDGLASQLQKQQQALQQVEETVETLSTANKALFTDKSAVEGRLHSSQQQLSRLTADLAKAELQLENAAAAKTKQPFFPMSPLASPPVRHDPAPTARIDHDKENKTSPTGRHGKTHTQAQAGAEAKQAHQDSTGSFLAAKLQHMQAENEALTGQVASLKEEQQKMQDAYLQADIARAQSQLNSEALELKVFTTLEQLALSEEKEADLAAALAGTAAAETAAAASQAAQAKQSRQLAAEQAEKTAFIARIAELEAQLSARTQPSNSVTASPQQASSSNDSATAGSDSLPGTHAPSDNPSSDFVEASSKGDASVETATLTSSPSVHAADGVSRPQHDKALVQEEIENPTGVSNCSSNSQDSLEKPHSGGSDSQSIADDMFDRSQILTNSYEDQVGSKETDAGHLTAPAAAARQNTAQHAEGQTATAHLESPLAAMHDAAEAASAVSSVAQAGSALLSSTRCAEEDKANTHPEPEDGSVDSATATEDVPKGKTVTEARSVDLPAAAAGTSTVGLTATEGRPVYLTAASLKQADGHATPLRVATRRRSALVGDEQAPSSPVYGVATSSAFNSPDSAMSRASSRDWLGGIFSGRNTSRKAAREAVKGGVNPTRLFEGLTRASSTAEDLFDSWHGPKPHAGRN